MLIAHCTRSQKFQILVVCNLPCPLDFHCAVSIKPYFEQRDSGLEAFEMLVCGSPLPLRQRLVNLRVVKQLDILFE